MYYMYLVLLWLHQNNINLHIQEDVKHFDLCCKTTSSYLTFVLWLYYIDVYWRF